MNINFEAMQVARMTDQSFEEPFAQVRRFDWDPPKRERNLKNRLIDFEDAKFVLNGPTFVRRSGSQRRSPLHGFRTS